MQKIDNMNSPPISFQEKWTTWQIVYSTFGYILAFYCSLLVLLLCCAFGVNAIKEMMKKPDDEQKEPEKEEEEPLKAEAMMEAAEEADSTNDAVINPGINSGMGEPVQEEMMM